VHDASPPGSLRAVLDASPPMDGRGHHRWGPHVRADRVAARWWGPTYAAVSLRQLQNLLNAAEWMGVVSTMRDAARFCDPNDGDGCGDEQGRMRVRSGDGSSIIRPGWDDWLAINFVRGSRAGFDCTTGDHESSCVRMASQADDDSAINEPNLCSTDLLPVRKRNS